MSVSLCPHFAASPACSVRDGSSSGSFLQGPSCPSLAAPFARRDRYYGRASINADRRLIIAHGAKWVRKKPASSTVIRKPDAQKSPIREPDAQKSPIRQPDAQKSPIRQPDAQKSPIRQRVAQKSPIREPDAQKSPIRQPDAQKSPIREPDAQKSPVSTGAPEWKEFSASVSGEWDGYSAEFNMFGDPLELPSDVVPDAFREWGQQIHDWQTQCPTLAHPEQGHLWYKVIRLLPTVGCEADAATVYSVEICDPQKTASALAYHKNGSYTAVWRGNRVTNEKQGPGPGKEVSREGDEIEVEQCLVHDKTRIRVLQKLGSRRHILIFREAWEGPFRNGESLGGCAAVTQAFSAEKPLLARSLFGKWNSDIYTLKDPQAQQGYSSSHLVSSGTEVIDKTFSSTFLYFGLPKDAWTLLLKTESGGTTIETGWLVQPDLALITKCEIGSSGDLKDVSLRVEKRVSSKVATVQVSAEELEDLLVE